MAARLSGSLLGKHMPELTLQDDAVSGRGRGEPRDLARELLVQRSPFACDGLDAGTGDAPQLGDAALDHPHKLGGRDEQAVTQEARHLERARRLGDPRADRRWSPCEAPRVPTQLNLGDGGQMPIDAQAIQQLDASEQCVDLPRRVLGGRRP